MTTACRTGNYGVLDPVSLEVCRRMFANQQWQMPAGLVPEQEHRSPEILTLWRAIKYCLTSPDVAESSNRGRHEQAFIHVVKHFGRDRLVESVWIPEIKEYQKARIRKGAAPSTVNKEKSALSKMFQVLMELRLMTANPARMVKSLSEKESKRSAYVGLTDFQRIMEVLPNWFKPVAQTAYYTGMRRGEVLGLTRFNVNLHKRLITLSSTSTKERARKKIPIHMDLVPILENLMKGQGTDKLFLHNEKPVAHRDEVRWCWDRRVARLEDLTPPPCFHDLRHTWKTNARRSGMHPEIEKAIMGHASRARNIHEGYGVIGDDELIKAIDLMTFDHGDTEIWCPEKKKDQQVKAVSL